MNQTLLGLVIAVVTVGAQVARADEFHGATSCGPRPTYAPVGQNMNTGRYEMQNVQRWVPGQQQQVWVAGQCYGGNGNGYGRQGRGGRGGGWNSGPRAQRCTQGSYQTVYTQGHYENRQEWVWVAYSAPQYRQYGAGFRVQNSDGSFSMSVSDDAT